MSLKYMAKLEAENNGNPYYACKYGYSDIVGYRDCFNCSRSADCDIFALDNLHESQDTYFQKLRAESMEYRATYYQNEYGFWFSDEGWQKVAKDKYLNQSTLSYYCWNGWAVHPGFWKCDKCKNLSACELGQYRVEKIARDKVQKKLKAQADLKKFTDAVKKPFEKVADIFDKVFK